jgi:hypothetical protein
MESGNSYQAPLFTGKGVDLYSILMLYTSSNCIELRYYQETASQETDYVEKVTHCDRHRYQLR